MDEKFGHIQAIENSGEFKPMPTPEWLTEVLRQNAKILEMNEFILNNMSRVPVVYEVDDRICRDKVEFDG